MGHYWMIAGYCGLKFQQPSVLDVGCGRGLLEEKLRAVSYSSYTGMDISMPALKKARQRIQPSCQLICADLLNPPIRKHFNVVIFNESLIPGMPIIDILRQYFGLLTADGRIIISLFNGRNRVATRPIWKEIGRSFQVEDATELENLPSQKSWTIALLAP
jgi:SAM-dependent methyltransferase